MNGFHKKNKNYILKRDYSQWTIRSDPAQRKENGKNK